MMNAIEFRAMNSPIPGLNDRMFRQQESMNQLKNLGFVAESCDERLVGFYYLWGRAAKTSQSISSGQKQ